MGCCFCCFTFFFCYLPVFLFSCLVWQSCSLTGVSPRPSSTCAPHHWHQHSLLPWTDVSHQPDDSVASPAFLSSNNPPSFVRFLHQWPHCSLIKAKPLLALEIFAYQWISLRPHQPERSSLPAPPPPAAQPALPAQGEWAKPAFRVPLRVPVWDVLTPRDAPGCICSLN